MKLIQYSAALNTVQHYCNIMLMQYNIIQYISILKVLNMASKRIHGKPPVNHFEAFLRLVLWSRMTCSLHNPQLQNNLIM